MHFRLGKVLVLAVTDIYMLLHLKLVQLLIRIIPKTHIELYFLMQIVLDVTQQLKVQNTAMVGFILTVLLVLHLEQKMLNQFLFVYVVHKFV
ncbi:hypothetical protein BJD20_20170 [Acinetobacter proteolyticus]|nr:hypothetical protein BJD20_20170 [Acinetobacter proteolyticus]